MILFPPAKINLGLNILSKREDGFHEIETCMVSIPFHDVLEIIPTDKFKFIQTGLTIDSPSKDNLVVRAFDLIRESYSISDVYIHLRKNIPMGAGLGGGSSDAAYMLMGLNKLFSLCITEDELEDMAAQLGSDCPFFIQGNAQLATGRGEVLSKTSLSLKGKYLKVVNPGIHIGTTEAYSGVQYDRKELSLAESLENPIEAWKGTVINGFEKSIFAKYPMIKKIKNQLYAEGAEYASMTGSGSTLYAIYNVEPSPSFPHLFEKIVLV